MHRIAVVEDTRSEQDALTRFLGRYAEQNGLTFDVSVYGTGEQFLEAHKPFDLVFMDIDMPGLDGMECAHLWRVYAPDTPLVFVTNLAHYALKGYEADALGFLVKPVTWSAFVRVMDKVRRMSDLHDRESILVPTKHGAYSVLTRSITHVEVYGHDVVYHLIDGQEPIRVRGSLKQAEEELAGNPFVRVSSSCLVNMDHIVKFVGDDLTVTGGEVLHFSRSRKKEATEAIVTYLAGR